MNVGGMNDGLPDSLSEYMITGGLLMLLMAVVAVICGAIALAKLLQIWSFRQNVRRAESWVLGALRAGDLRLARQDCEKLSTGVATVFASGLDRALGKVRGDPPMAMRREERRAVGRLRSLVWVLGSVGALMPFVGLLGTVLGVMASFHAIGVSAASGFDVVASGISEALIATAAGLFVALEAIVLYNLLQNAVAAQGRELSLLVDEALEILRTTRTDDELQQPQP